MAKATSAPMSDSYEPIGRLDQRIRDIIGIALIFVSVAGFYCLYGPNLPLFLQWLRGAMQDFAGLGAFVFPLSVALTAVLLLRGHPRFSLNHMMVGFFLLLLVIVVGQYLHFADTTSDAGNCWEARRYIADLGGIIGCSAGWPIRALIGPRLSWILLVFISAIATILIVDRPLAEILRPVGERAGGLFRRGFGRRAVSAGGADEDSGADHGRPRGAAEPPGTRAIRDRLTDDGDEPTVRHNPLQSMWDKLHVGGDRQEPGAARAATATAESPSRASGRAEEPAAEEGVALVAGANRAAADPERAGRKSAAGAGAGAAGQLAMPLFALPPLDLLNAATPAVAKRSQSEVQERAETIERTLDQFGIKATVVEVASGPTVTRYEIQLAPGIKVSKIVGLADNLSMSLAAIDVRVEAPIPGKAAIGLEVPNNTRTQVHLRECLENPDYQKAESKLTVALGKDVSGQFKYADLTKMPHLLIGGSTNSGKSVCLNVLIASLVYRATPREVKLMMIDPKRVELTLWNGIPHLMHPVVTDVKQAAGIFRAAIKEMDKRYDLFSAVGTRNIDGYNQRVPQSERLPYIVLIVDELADLMMLQGAEVEQSICRLAQLARATGIHLVIATQRPSVDIITGTIKANIGSRIAFAVASQVDSRTILDMMGADRLIGRGDMLYMPMDAAKPMRIQGAYLSEPETNAIVDYLRKQEQPDFSFTLSEGADGQSGGENNSDDVDDQFFEQAVRLVVNNGQASTSMLQRRFRIGYTRAARIVEMMEERGIVGPLNGAKPREIMVSRDEVERMFNPGGTLPSVAEYQDEG